MIGSSLRVRETGRTRTGTTKEVGEMDGMKREGIGARKGEER